jgi:hypothetical protein
MKIIQASIDVMKIDKNKLFKGSKGTYLNSKKDEYGNNGTIYESQTEEEQKNKVPKVILGNCKIVFSNSNDETNTTK